MTSLRWAGLGLAVMALVACGLGDETLATPSTPVVVPAPDAAPILPVESPATGFLVEGSEPDTVQVVATTLSACAGTNTTVEISGHPVLVRTPATSSPVPLIVAVHGYKGTPEGLEQLSRLTELLGDVASIVYPSGTPLDLGYGWNSGAGRFATRDGDDVAYLRDVVDFASANGCPDVSKVVLVGESNGGGMVVRSACDERFAGIVDAVVLVNPAIDDGVLAACGATPPVRVLATMGLLDAVVGFDGKREPFVAADRWFGEIARVLGGCQGGSNESRYSATVALRIAGDCAECAALYIVEDGPHTWPGRPILDDGYIPGTFPLTELLRSLVTNRDTVCL